MVAVNECIEVSKKSVKKKIAFLGIEFFELNRLGQLLIVH